MPYSRSPWSDITGEDWTLEIQCIPGRFVCFQGEELRTPDFSTDEDKTALVLRHLCHLLIERINSMGLPEACQSLAEFYEYYRPTGRPRGLLAASRTPDAIPGDQPAAIRRVFPAVEEQPFRISED
ncbi:MAG: hypothetical protein ABSH20_10585 [Tepidisphaeraceae bacterium]|jgi:hypothetical protein